MSISQFDSFTKDQWVDYLKDGAYRGAKINKMARKNTSSSKLIKVQNQIHLIYGTKTVKIKLAKLLKKHEDWTLARLVHNIKMALSSDYEKDFNERIEKLADRLIQNAFTDDDIKAFFNANQKFINGSTGNQKVQDDLFMLARKATDPNLAHMIAAKATGVMPLPAHMDFTALPADILGHICSHMESLEAVNRLFVANKVSNNVSKAKNQWINDNNVCLKELGCETAKEAVQYVIDNKLTSANLSAFKELNDADLESLRICTGLKKLSLSHSDFTGTKLGEVLHDFKDLQHVKLHVPVLNDNAIKALAKSGNLQSLDLSGCSIVTGDIAEIFEKHRQIRVLKLDDLKISDRASKAIVNLEGLYEFSHKGWHPLTLNQIIEILGNHTQIQRLHLPNQVPHYAIANLDNLHYLDITDCPYSDDQIAKILEKHTHLQSLKLGKSGNVETAKAIANLNNLQELDMNIDAVLLMDDHPGIQKLHTAGQANLLEIEEILRKFPALKGLSLYCNPLIINGTVHINDWVTDFRSIPEVKDLIKKYPHVQIII